MEGDWESGATEGRRCKDEQPQRTSPDVFFGLRGTPSGYLCPWPILISLSVRITFVSRLACGSAPFSGLRRDRGARACCVRRASPCSFVLLRSFVFLSALGLDFSRKARLIQPN